jgi:hypothetical protein
VVTTGIFQLAQHGQDVTADRAAEYAELMLQTHDVHVADVQKIGSSQVRRQILFFDLEANYLRVVIAVFYVVDRNTQALALRILVLYGREQIGGKGGDAALARQVVTDKRDFADLCCRFWVESVGRHAFHLLFSIMVNALRCGEGRMSHSFPINGSVGRIGIFGQSKGGLYLSYQPMVLRVWFVSLRSHSSGSAPAPYFCRPRPAG